MRELLFRGKTQDGDWTYGYYVFTPKRTGAFGQTISPADFDRHYILTMKFNIVKEVIPETVGQYTGLTDKNGKKIFEGDIVRIKTSCNGEKATEITRVGYDYKFCGFFPMRWEESCDGCDCYFSIEEIEVIGNIHDNPELLKGGAE